MKLIYKTNAIDGKLNSAELEDARGRRFHWCRRLPVQQEINAKNPHGAGQCEIWHRKAGKNDALCDERPNRPRGHRILMPNSDYTT